MVCFDADFLVTFLKEEACGGKRVKVYCKVISKLVCVTKKDYFWAFGY